MKFNFFLTITAIVALLIASGCLIPSESGDSEASNKDSGLNLPADSADSEAPPQLPDESGNADAPPGIFG